MDSVPQGMDSVAEGNWFQITIGSKSRVVAWSHRSRFEKALSLSGRNNKKLLDYGCGDGTFLALASDRFVEGHGVDIDADQIEDCRNRLASFGNVSFFVVGDLAGTEHNRTYDVITCMETLEHCIEPVVEKVLADMARLCAADGRVIISVPVEVGPSFLVKRIARRQAVSMDKAHETYPLRDALKMLFARKHTFVERPVYSKPQLVGHSHYGFNWRRLRERVRHYLVVDDTLFTPLGFLGGWVSSQVYFVCRPRL